MKLLPLLALAAAPAALHAQARDSIAFASPRGAYVWMKGTAVSPAHPVNGVAAHRLERSHPGGKWETVADVSAAPDAPSFFSRLDSLTRAAVVRALGAKSEAAAWDHIVRFPYADSLAGIIGNDEVRLALGIYGLDPEPRDGETWQYRVSDVDTAGKVGNAVVTNSLHFPPGVQFDSVAVARSEGDDSIAIAWWYVGKRGTRAKAVEIWRREGRTGDFGLIDSVAVSIRSGDSLLARSEDRRVQPGHMYQYYAVPRDLFFNRGAPGDTVTIYTVPLAGVVLPDSIRARGVDTLGIVLTWRLRRPPGVRTLQVFRSTAQNGEYVQIAEVPSSETSFVDLQVEPMRMYYYRLGMTGLRGTESPRTAAVFGYFEPALPPSPPLAVQADTAAGGFRIHWTPGDDPHLTGYRVYRTDAPLDSLTDSTAMQLVSPLLPAEDSSFRDSSSALGSGRQYTWAVRAVGAGNRMSEYSNPAMAARFAVQPAPVPAGLTGYAAPGGIVLSWDDMTRSDPLVSGYLVLRRTGARGAWDTLPAHPLGREENRYRDTTAERGTWQYAVVSVDVAGSRSEPSIPVTLSRAPAPPPAPAGFRIQEDSGAVLLAWDPLADSSARVRIYRYQRGGKTARLGEVPAGDLGYLDRTAKQGLRYYYYLTTVSGGVEGARSGERSYRR